MVTIAPQKNRKDTQKYSVATIAQAIGRSEDSITGIFSNKGIPTKGGLTLAQIVEVINTPIRGKIIDWQKVDEIRQRLKDEYGYTIEVS